MSFIGLRVPAETARLLWGLWESDYARLGDTAPRDHAHITILNLGKDVPIDQLARAVEAVYTVTSRTRPFTVSTNRVSVFPPNDEDEVPIICPVDSPQLHDLHERLQTSFNTAGIEYSKKFPEFKPHVTLAYSKDPLVAADWGPDIGFLPVTWGAHEATLWGGNQGDSERLMVNFPFPLNPHRGAVRRALVRAAVQRASCSAR